MRQSGFLGSTPVSFATLDGRLVCYARSPWTPETAKPTRACRYRVGDPVWSYWHQANRTVTHVQWAAVRGFGFPGWEVSVSGYGGREEDFAPARGSK